MNEKVTDAEILKNIKIYTVDGLQIHTMMRDTFIEKDNQMGVLKHQGSIDTCQDILKVLNGVKVVPLAEVQADLKKQESSDQDYLR